MIFNILDNTTELWMTKYIIGEFFSSSGATLYENPSDQTVNNEAYLDALFYSLAHCDISFQITDILMMSIGKVDQ